MSKLFDIDPLTGIRTYFHTEDGKSVLSKSQDLSENLRLNKIDRNHSQQASNMRKVASVPVIVWEMWGEELKAQGKNPDPFHKENRVWLIARLNNSDWGKLRTNEDRL